jgi:hypothetical protein
VQAVLPSPPWRALTASVCMYVRRTSRLNPRLSVRTWSTASCAATLHWGGSCRGYQFVQSVIGRSEVTATFYLQSLPLGHVRLGSHTQHESIVPSICTRCGPKTYLCMNYFCIWLIYSPGKPYSIRHMVYDILSIRCIRRTQEFTVLAVQTTGYTAIR